MEYRKIIKFGNSSYVISLPNYWLKKNNLNKGDTISFEENGDSELVFYSKPTEKKEDQKEIVLESNNKPNTTLIREIISAYINNYHLIKVVGKNLDSKSKEIRNIIHSLVGMEIIEQSNNTIIAKDFLNTKEISLHGIIRRSDTIIRNMIRNSMECFKTDHCISIENSDHDVNRLHFVVKRVTTHALKNPQSLKELNLDHSELMNMRLLMNDLGSFADECKSISILFRKRTKKEITKELLGVYTDIENSYIEAMVSFYNKDNQLGYKVLEKRNQIIKKNNELLEKYSDPNIARIIEKFNGMIMYIKGICRTAINATMS